MIEVGEYVRCEHGRIEVVTYQLKKFIDEHISKSENNRVEFLGKIKHSKNIIDLIEVGDYVNGYKVRGKTNEKVVVDYYCYSEELAGGNWLTFYKANIISIVTKEQFASMEYKVKEEIC